jgi:DNA polymerase III epsilon subunit-like protein
MLVFDVETTGLPKSRYLTPKNVDDWPHIVQIAWILNDEEKMFYVKPDNYIIPEESTKIHGITTDFADKNGLPIKQVLDIFEQDCNQADILVAHNADFDKNVILASCYRNKRNSLFLLDKKIYCTMKSNVEVCKLPGKYGYKYPRLEELYYFLFKKKPTKLHDALVDCRITKLCHERQKNII